MKNPDVVPCNGVYQLGIQTPNISLNLLAQFVNVQDLWFKYPASLSMIDLSLTPTPPLVNIRHLTLLDVVPGLEFLLDGVMLPNLRSLDVMLIQLFVALASRANQMKALDTIEYLVILDQADTKETSFSLKQWYIVLDALPRLRTLLIHILNGKCPPMAMADLLIDYIKRARQMSLTIFSFYIDDKNDKNSKEHFVNCLADTMEAIFVPAQLAQIGETRLYAWF
jgi:hypothetical protein